MTPLSSNPDLDFSAGYGKKEFDLGDWQSEFPLSLNAPRRSRNTCARRGVDWQSGPAGYVNEGTAETASVGGLLPPLRKGRKETILTARSWWS